MFLLAAWMLVSAPRERAVLIYPRERVWFRRAFHTSHQRDLQRQLQQRYAVEVHDQVATDDQLFAIDIRGAKLLVLSAHGCPYGMSFNGKHQRTLDGSDQARLSAFFSQLAPDATIILQSCYTGLGFARTVKKAAGPNRHGPREAGNRACTRRKSRDRGWQIVEQRGDRERRHRFGDRRPAAHRPGPINR